ncbi:MAG: hypothetical protein QM697_04425 [Lachnospiraceae bacterium]
MSSKRNKYLWKSRELERRDKREFLSLLKQAWMTGNRHFSEKERRRYREWIDYLQFAEEPVKMDKEELKELYGYINKTVQAYLSDSVKIINKKEKTLEEFQNIYLIIEYFLIEHQGEAMVTGLSELLYLLMRIEQYNPEKLEALMELYEESELLYKICYYLHYYFDYSCDEQMIHIFLSGIRYTKTYKLFSMFLYQINPAFFKNKKQILLIDCNPKELFYGICSGYFLYWEGNAVHKRLVELCETNKMCIEEKLSVENPLFGLFMLYRHGYLKSLKDYAELLRDSDLYKLLYLPTEVNYKEVPIKWLEIINTEKCLKNVIAYGGMNFYYRIFREVQKYPYLGSKEIYRSVLKSKDQMI